MVTRATVFREVQRQFRTEFAGLDTLSVLQYLRVRLMPVSQERFLDRLPHLRQVTKYKGVSWFLFFFCFLIFDVAKKRGCWYEIPCHVGISLVVSFLLLVYTIRSGRRCGVGEDVCRGCRVLERLGSLFRNKQD